MREGFVFYRSFAKAIKNLDAQTKAQVIDILCDYALDGIEPDETGIAAALFELMRPQVDANNRRYENGKKGGRPKTEKEPEENQTETKAKPNKNQTEPKTDSVEPKEKDKEKDKDKVKDKKHIYGAFKHVLLTDSEHDALVGDFGINTVSDAIRRVDEYCETSGKRYRNYNLVIRKWGITAGRKEAPTYDIDALEQALVNR